MKRGRQTSTAMADYYRREVRRLLAEGRLHKEVAALLGISRGMVTYYANRK